MKTKFFIIFFDLSGRKLVGLSLIFREIFHYIKGANTVCTLPSTEVYSLSSKKKKKKKKKKNSNNSPFFSFSIIHC